MTHEHDYAWMTAYPDTSVCRTCGDENPEAWEVWHRPSGNRIGAFADMTRARVVARQYPGSVVGRFDDTEEEKQ